MVRTPGFHHTLFSQPLSRTLRVLSLSLFVTILFCSCTTDQKVPIFNGITFDLHQGETVGDIGQDVKDVYTLHFNNSDIQIPLFKYIRHEDYEIFIGIPFNTTLEQLISQRGTENHTENRPPTYYKTSTIDGQYLIEFAGRFNGNNLLYIAALTDSEAVARSFLNADTLSDRIEPQ